MRKIKKIIAALLVLAVALSVMAAPVSAAERSSYPYIYTDSPVLTPISVGDSVIYQFVPLYTGIYSFYSEGEKDSFAVLRNGSFEEIAKNDDSSEENLNFCIEEKLYANNSYYLECSLSSRKDSGEYVVTAKKLSGTEYIQILGDKQIEGAIGGSVTLEAEIYPDDDFEGYSWYSNNTGVADVDQNGVVSFLSTGYAEIVVVTNETQMTDSVNVYVADYFEINSGSSVSNIITTDKPSHRYKFTPEESGKYPVIFNSANGEYININILNTTTNDNIYSYYSDNHSENVEFKAGYSYIIEVFNYDSKSDIEFFLGISTLVALNSVAITDYNGNDIETYSEYIGKTYSLTVRFDPEDIREEISWSSSADDIVSVDDYGNITLKSEGYAIITATAKSGVSDTLTVNVKDYVNVVLNAGYNEFLNKNGDRYVFRFTPEEDGYYCIKASNHSGYGMAIKLLDNEYGDTLYGDYKKTYNFIAGYEYLIEIKADGEDFQPANFTFSIEKMNTATEIHLYRRDNVYDEISYLSGYEGYDEYLTYKFAPEDAYDETVIWETTDKNIAYVEGERLHYVGAGVATITARVESGASTTLTVEVYAARNITVNRPVTVSPTEPNQTVIYKYTHTKWYDSVGFKIDSEYYINCRIKEVGSDSYIIDYNGNQFTAQPELEVGKTYYIMLKCNGREYGDYSVTAIPLKKAEAIYIDGDEVINGYSGTSIGLSYNFGEGDFINESVTWSSNNKEVADVNEHGTVTFVGAGTAVITVTSENNLTDSVTVYVSEMPTANIGEETTVTVNTENERKFYKFTVEEDGKYAVYVNSEMYTYMNLGLLDGNGTIDFSSCGYAYRVEFEAESGAEYFLETYIADGGTLTGSYTFQIVKLSAPKEMYFTWGGNILNGTFKTYTNSEGWLDIKFGPEGSYSESYTVKGDNDEVAEISEYGYARFKKAGIVNVTAVSENGLIVTLTIEVGEIPYIQLGEHYGVEYTRPDDYRYYKFTPDETGYYKFDVYTGIGGNTDIYDSYGKHIGNIWYGNAESNFGIYKLYAGETYDIRMYLYDEQIGSNTLLVTRAKLADAIRFRADIPSEFYVGESQVFEIEPMLRGDDGNYYPAPEDVFVGGVNYSVSDKTVAEIFEGNAVRFIKDGTVTIYAVAECGARTQMTVTVSGGKTISLGETVSGYLENWNSEIRYKFTPEKDGVYGAFFNNLNYDVINGDIAVYDEENGTYRILENDGGSEFVLQYKMTAGKTYYIIAHSGYGNFNITVREITTPATSVYFNIQQPNYCIVGDRYYLDANIEFLPEGSIREDYTLSVSDDTVARIDGEDIEYIGAGTVTVTVTSENGLTDSFDVTVKNPIELEIGKTETYTTEHPHEEVQFNFTVEEEGWYGIYMNSDCDMNYTYGYIENGGKYHYDNSWFEKTYVREDYLYPERTYFMNVYEDTCNKISTTDITVRKLVEAAGFSIEEDEVTGYIGDQIKLNSSFTPIYSKSEEIYWSSTDETIASVENGEITIHSKGTAIITATTESNFTDSVKVESLGYETISVGDEKNTTLSSGNIKYYEFTPSADATYIISSVCDGDPFIYLYDKDFNELLYDDDGGSNNNFKIIYSFNKDTTYYLGLSAYELLSTTVKIEERKIEELFLGKAIDVSLSEGQSQMFAFTPNETKTYKLYSEGNYDTYAILYDSDFNIICENDGENGPNFAIAYTLEANNTYYLEVMGYNYQPVECTVKVKEIVGVEEVKIIKLPNKTEYYAGFSAQALNLEGLEALITFTDGTSQIWKYGYSDMVGDYTVRCETNYSEIIGDIESVYVMCGDKADEFPITIIENPVESIEVIHNGILLYEGYGCWYHPDYNYNIYGVDYSDLLFKINYTDGSFAVSSMHSSIDGYSFDYTESQHIGNEWTVGGDNPIMIYYCGQMVTVNANMVRPEVKSVKVLSSPDYVYQWGDEQYGYVDEDGAYNIYDYNFVGLSLELTYNNGTTEVLNVGEDNEYELRNKASYKSLPVTESGTYIAPISYFGCEFEMSITVNKPDAVSIEVIKDPDVTVSAYGSSYDFDGMQLKITDSNGGTKTVTVKDNCKFYGYIGYYVIELEDDCIFIYYYYDEEGNERLNIVYGEASCLYDGMTMIEEECVTDFEVIKFSLDPSEIEISATFADGSTVSYKGIDTVEYADQYGFHGYVKTVYGLIGVSVGNNVNKYDEIIGYYVNFGDYGTQIDGSVTIESIEVNTLPNKTHYGIGEKLDPTGLTIKVNYSDGSSKIIDSGYKISVKMAVFGNSVVNVSYAGYTTSFEISGSSGGDLGGGEKIYGDANGDGTVNTDDLVELQKVLLGVENESYGCDANGDGDVNILDFIRMKKHFSDENTPLGPDASDSVTTEVAWIEE